MKRITAIVGVVMAVMLISVTGAYGAGKAACGGTTGEGVSSAGATGQGVSGVGIEGHSATGTGSEAGGGLSSEGVTGGSGNRSSAGVRVGSSMGRPQEYMVPGRLNVNLASSDELLTVPGIDRSLANQIVEYRLSNGPLDSVDELIRVQGADEEKLDKARPFLKVQGPSNFQYDLVTRPPRPNPFPRYSTESQ